MTEAAIFFWRRAIFIAKISIFTGYNTSSSSEAPLKKVSMWEKDEREKRNAFLIPIEYNGPLVLVFIIQNIEILCDKYYTFKLLDVIQEF